MAFKKFRLYQRVIDDLKRRSIFGIVFYPVVLILVLLPGGYYHRHPEFSKQFIVFIVGICLFRLIHYPVAKHLEPRFVKFNNGVFLTSVALTALIWGIGFAKFMFQAGELNADLMMIMCTIGLSSGAAVAFLPDFRLALVFTFFMLVPAIGVMLFSPVNIPLLTAFILMFLYLCFMAYRGNREYWDALENEFLLEEKSRALEKISRLDGLTGLHNRRYFDEVYEFEWNRSVRKKQPITIILADIDHFKEINDQYGHLAGDEYLKSISGILSDVFKRKMDVIARYGGEEFIILMPSESGKNALKLADRTRSKIQKFELEFEGQSFNATLSLGIATSVPDNNQSSQMLISRADEALYQSKIDGRNRVTVSK